jgi:hypothetical protein
MINDIKKNGVSLYRQHGHKIILQWLKNDTESFNMNIDKCKELWRVRN